MVVCFLDWNNVTFVSGTCRNTKCRSRISCGFLVLDTAFCVAAASSRCATTSWSFISQKFAFRSNRTRCCSWLVQFLWHVLRYKVRHLKMCLPHFKNFGSTRLSLLQREMLECQQVWTGDSFVFVVFLSCCCMSFCHVVAFNEKCCATEAYCLFNALKVIEGLQLLSRSRRWQNWRI